MSCAYMRKFMLVCFRLFKHEIERAFSRALLKAGSSMAARIAIIAMTTNNSIRVNYNTFITKLLATKYALIGKNKKTLCYYTPKNIKIQIVYRYFFIKQPSELHPLDFTIANDKDASAITPEMADGNR